MASPAERRQAASIDAPDQSDPEREVGGELRHLRDLVFLRELLRDRGATGAELAGYDATVAHARAGLAESVRRAAASYDNAA